MTLNPERLLRRFAESLGVLAEARGALPLTQVCEDFCNGAAGCEGVALHLHEGDGTLGQPPVWERYAVA